MRHIHGGDLSNYDIYSSDEIIDFSVNINPLGMPDAVREAARMGVDAANRYPQPYARSFCEKIAVYENAKLKQNLEKEASEERQRFIFSGNGAADLIFLLTRALRPEEGIIFTPAFAEYEAALRAQGTSISLIPLNENDCFVLKRRHLGILRRHLAAKEEEEGRQTRVVFVCQPGNPTGVLIEEEQLEELVQICRKFDAWLIIDACFVPLLEEEETARQEALLGRCQQYERAVILRAFTKAFAMPGLRLGYLVCRDSSLISQLEDVSQPWSISQPAIEAGMAALEEQEYLRWSRAYLQTEKEKLLGCLEKMAEQEKPGVIDKIYGSAANYIFFHGAAGLAEKLLERGILIRDCSNFTGLEEGYYRIAVRTTEENNRLIQVLGELEEHTWLR